MIAISDNTATDALLWEFGRDRIDGRLAAWGFHSRPMLFSTAEMFALSAGLGDLPQSPEIRRKMLGGLDRRAAYAMAGEALDAIERDRDGAMAKVETYYETAPYLERRALSHLLDWRITPEELASFYARVALGKFESPAVSGIVARYLAKGGDGMLGAYLRGDERKKAVARKGGSDTGILTDGGYVPTTDDRHVAVVVMADDLPPDASDEMMVPRLSELSQLIFDYLEPRGRR